MMQAQDKIELLTRPFSELNFSEEDHRYWIYDQPTVGLTSATTIIAQFNEAFDSKGISEAYAEKRGGVKEGYTPESVREEWQIGGANAADAGTQLHEYAEMLGQEHLFGYVPDLLHGHLDMACFERVKAYLEYRGQPIARELRMYDPEYGVSGTGDMIFDAPAHAIDLEDWKSLKYKYFDDPFGGKKMYPPFDYLVASKRNKARIQLNLYRYMIEKYTPLKVRTMAILMVRYDDGRGMPQRIVLEKIPNQIIEEALTMIAAGVQPCPGPEAESLFHL